MKRAIEKSWSSEPHHGRRIAAHVANAGVWCALLDIVPPEPKRRGKKTRVLSPTLKSGTAIVRAASLRRQNPGRGIFNARARKNASTQAIVPRNLKLCAKRTGIIEVVAENLEIKRALARAVCAGAKTWRHCLHEYPRACGAQHREGWPEEWQQALGRHATSKRCDSQPGFFSLGVRLRGTIEERTPTPALATMRAIRAPMVAAPEDTIFFDCAFHSV